MCAGSHVPRSLGSEVDRVGGRRHHRTPPPDHVPQHRPALRRLTLPAAAARRVGLVCGCDLRPTATKPIQPDRPHTGPARPAALRLSPGYFRQQDNTHEMEARGWNTCCARVEAICPCHACRALITGEASGCSGMLTGMLSSAVISICTTASLRLSLQLQQLSPWGWQLQAMTHLVLISSSLLLQRRSTGRSSVRRVHVGGHSGGRLSRLG